MTRRFVFAILFWAMSIPAFAGQVLSTGAIDKVFLSRSNQGVHDSGGYRSGWTQIFRTTADWKGVSADTCKHRFSMVQGAGHATSGVTVSCEDHEIINRGTRPIYGGAPATRHIMIR